MTATSSNISSPLLALLDEGAIERAAVIDLDVHQGNGTASILAGEPRAFTFSMHGRNNFPFTKVASTLDLAVEDGTGDAEYLALLAEALPRVLSFDPDIIFYQAGVDALEQDALGRLAMTHQGLMERDRMVLAAAREHDVPIVLTLGGGYAKPIAETVRAHVGTYRAAKEMFGERVGNETATGRTGEAAKQ